MIAPVNLRLLALFPCTAAAIGIWLAATACYRADDYGLLREAWAGGDFGDALAHWWNAHTAPRDPGGWPKFYRPVWHASYLVDAHLFGASAAASAAISWALHCATALLAGRLLARTVGNGPWPWFTAWLCLLPGAAVQAAVWIAGRGQLLAALFAVLAMLAATSTRWPLARRLLATLGAVLLAAGSHDAGVLAAPLAAAAAFVMRPQSLPRPALAVAIALPLVAAVAWTLWRASRLGSWVGGYPSTNEAISSSFRIVQTILSGIGAVVLPLDDELPIGVTLGVGALGLAVLLAGCLLRSPARGPALLALALAVGSLVPAIGSTFRTGDLTNGRYLYTANVGWSLGVGLGLASLAARGAHRLARGLALLTVATAAIGFALWALDYQAALRTTHALFAAIDRLPTDQPLVLGAIPDRQGSHVIARNALPAALGPPFRTAMPHIRAHATDLDLTTGRILHFGTQAAIPPRPTRYGWDATTSTLEPQPWSHHMRWRGVIERTADGAWTCAGIRLAPQSVDASLRDGVTVELLATLRGEGAHRELEVHAVEPWQPLLTPPPQGSSDWRFQGQPGDALILLAGTTLGCLDLGPAGTLAIEDDQRFPLGVAGSDGTLAFALPEPAAAAPLLQAFVLRGFGPGIVIGELHEARRFRR